jgi:hypothetical protein
MRVTTRMRIVGATLAIGLGFGMAVALPASPAGAGPPGCSGDANDSPDGRIRLGNGAFVGNGQYPATVLDVDNLGVGQSAVFTLKWKNKTANPATIRLRQTGFLRDAGYSIKYFADGVDVSKKLREGKQVKFANIAANKSTPDVVLVIKNKSNPNFDDGALTRLGGRYAGSTIENCDQVGGVVNLEP